MKLVVFLCLIAYFSAGINCIDYYPASIADITSTHSATAISCLAVKDQSGATDTWAKYIEFDSVKKIYSGTFTFNVAAGNIATATLSTNFRGQPYASQQWMFEVLLNNPNEYFLIGTTNPNTAGWGSWSAFTYTITANLNRMINAQNQIQIRFRSNKALDAGQLDFLQLSLTFSTGSTSSTSSATSSTSATPPPTSTSSASSTSSTSATPPPTATSSTSSTSSTSATPPPTATSSTSATPPPTSTSTSSTPSTTSTSASATSTSTSSTPSTSTSGSTTSSGPSVYCNLKMLVLCANKADAGLDFVSLTFDSVGMPYDIVVITTTTSLSVMLSTAGVGKYAGIVTMTKTLLSADQQKAVVDYQKFFGVKLVVLGSTPAGLPGLVAGTATSTKGTLTLASEFYNFAHPLRHTVSVDSQKCVAWSNLAAASVTPANSVSDTSVATPAILYNGNKIAAAAVKFPDGTRQLHYFMAQSASYFHSRIFSVILLNWLSPGGVFIGQRQITLAVQPDDLFMASNLWDTKTHKNPLSATLIYRITPDDLQKCANYVSTVNDGLPAGSHVTIEWPYNGAGTTWYTQPDPLLAKAKELQNLFYFVTHTWDHPCTFDTAPYADVFAELKNNFDWTPNFLTNGMKSSLLSNDSMVNPCITGLFNGNCLKAMADNGIKYAVVATHGYAGIFIIPREAYDIDYDNSVPAELVDQFNTENKLKWTFEQIMDLQVDYAMEKKTGFRHDAFMFHQANTRFFDYVDPDTHVTRSVSLTTLWMERVIKNAMLVYNLPIVSPPFGAMAKIWKDREAMDNCGLTATVEIRGGNVVGISGTSTQVCEIPFSGAALSGPQVNEVKYPGDEIVSLVTSYPGSSLSLSLVTPVPV